MVDDGLSPRRWDAGVADLRSGEMRLVSTAGGDVLVANVGGALYAVIDPPAARPLRTYRVSADSGRMIIEIPDDPGPALNTPC